MTVRTKRQDDNDNVTVAILKTEMGHVIKALDSLGVSLAQRMDEQNDRLCAAIADHETRLRSIERSSPRGDIAAIVTAVVGSIAAFLGNK